MIGARALHFIERDAPPETHGQLLKTALVVGLAGLADSFGDPGGEQGEDDPLHLGQAPVEVDGAEYGLRCVGQDRLFFPSPREVLTPPEREVLGQA